MYNNIIQESLSFSSFSYLSSYYIGYSSFGGSPLRIIVISPTLRIYYIHYKYSNKLFNSLKCITTCF